jgi:hypothetical protein
MPNLEARGVVPSAQCNINGLQACYCQTYQLHCFLCAPAEPYVTKALLHKLFGPELAAEAAFVYWCSGLLCIHLPMWRRTLLCI